MTTMQSDGRHPLSAPRFERLLGRVHRRLLAMRVLESGGLGALIGCGFALPLVGLFAWRGVSGALEGSTGCVILGALTGITWGVVRRPSLIEAAMEADRQLRLADLLGSALLVRDRDNDPWCVSVLAEADLRCSTLSPAAVILNRLGARAWGSIGLGVALVMTISAMAAAPGDSHAAIPGFALGAPNDSSHTASAQPLVKWTPESARRPSTPADADDLNASKIGNDPTGSGDTRPTAPKPDEGASVQNPTAGPNGGGTGAARTERPTAATTPPTPDVVAAHSTNHDQRSAAAAGTGQGDARELDAGHDQVTGVTAGSQAQGTGAWIAPWQSDQWPQDVSRAQGALRGGQIPPPFRDMVRAYFQR